MEKNSLMYTFSDKMLRFPFSKTNFLLFGVLTVAPISRRFLVDDRKAQEKPFYHFTSSKLMYVRVRERKRKKERESTQPCMYVM